MVMLMTVFLCSLSAWCQSSVVTIGKAVTQCNDFAFAKKMIVNEGLTFDKKESTSKCAVFKNSPKYADDVMVIKLYKKGTNKVDKCVIIFAGDGKFGRTLASDQRNNGYTYDGPAQPNFAELYSCNHLGMGLDRDAKGYLVATFLRYDQ